MENCDFFPGHVVKNWDCPGKSGTDGHLRTAAPNFRPIYCSQTAGWIMMPLDTEVWPRPRRHCVRWGPSSPSPKSQYPLLFGPCLFWPSGWMDHDATWYGGRSRPRRHCIRWGHSCPRKGYSSPLFSAHVYCGQTVAHLSYCWVLGLNEDHLPSWILDAKFRVDRSFSGWKHAKIQCIACRFLNFSEI